MTYKTRQEVLRAAADWMDKAGVDAVGRHNGIEHSIKYMGFDCNPEGYEFPLALLEGKEVWIGSELYWDDGPIAIVTEDWNSSANWKRLSWNPPKPATVMVEHLVKDVEEMVLYNYGPVTGAWRRMLNDCKKALENLT